MTFTLELRPGPSDMDELGHVNNAVYVRWVQDAATAHWFAMATPEEHAAMIWIVVRHEINYRAPSFAGELLRAETWVGAQRGARFDRHVRIAAPDGKVRAEAVTTWALIDRASGRPMRVPAELAERFR